MSDSEASNGSDQQYTVVDQINSEDDSKSRRSRRRESKTKKPMADQEFATDEENSNSTVPPSRYEEDDDYQEPGKKKRSSRGSEKKKSKKKSKHQDSEEEVPIEETSIVEESHRSVPPLKIKLPPREKSKRSSTKKKADEETSFANEEDEFDGNAASTSSRKASKPAEESASTAAPTRRSERIFVSNAKKVAETVADDEAEETVDELENFKIIHRDYCQGCRQGGELFLCDYCPRAYHKVCLDEELDELPDDWCCPHCQKNGKPDPKELRQQQEAFMAKKKKKQQPSKPTDPAKSQLKAKPKDVENRDYCEICNQCGELLLCDTCPRAYHVVCIDPDMKVPSGTWSCPHCEEFGMEYSTEVPEEKTEKAEKIICKGCRQTGGEIVFCASCPTRYHIGCVNPPLDEMPEVWYCLACSVEPLKGKVQRIITWRWKKAKETSENDSEKTNLSAEDDTKNLLKNLKNRRPREREFFVKWKDMSYWHCSWIDESQLQVFHGNMYRFYAQKNDMTNPPVFDEVGMQTTNIVEPVKDETSTIDPTNEAGVAASIAAKNRRRKRCSNLPPEVEDTYIRYGVRPEWLLIQRIVNHRKSRGKMFYIIKWRDLPYEEVTMEAEPENCDFEIPDFQKKIDDYWNLRRLVEEETGAEDESSSKKKRDKDGKSKKDKKKKSFGMQPKTDPKKKWEAQPEYIPEPLKLHEYQREGISWLRYSWVSGIDTILADEMGLGKTIQTVIFLYSLYKEGHSRGPFLIAAPLSTIINWERELEDWAPDFYVVNYTGNKDSRIIIREHELSFDSDVIRSAAKATRIRKHVPVKFHVLLTSYELINVDSALLGSIDWKVLVVDEAHRLKSNQSLFFRTLNQYNVGHKLLLTGTPLQNNLEELFNLLNFLSPDRFNDMDGFLNEFADIAKEEQVKKLHELLGPHLLRRLKADVLSGMPAKSEFILRVDLAGLQKKYYKYILTRNFDALNSKGGGKQVSLLNIVMDLKKCCNHPYLFPVAAEEAPKTKFGYFEGSALVKASGKLIILQKMLRKLNNDGHRVLIFSQMTQMLDVLEDFLEAEGYKYERIDGSITGSVRQEAIDRFNTPGAKQFVFLLSTRAGGLGINLATADTVIIYDSDWNPHNDIQALSRAHRIGQMNKVMIYRFVTRNSVEERITQVAKKKMMLTHLVVRPGLGSNKSSATMSKQELDDILKFGTEELFKEEEGKETETIHYDDQAIDELLDRTKEGIEQKEMWSNEYLSSFKVASYVTKEAEEEEEEAAAAAAAAAEAAAKKNEEAQNDPHYWEKLLGAHYMQFQENISRSLGKGKRVRKQVNYLDSASGQNEYQNHESQSESSDFSVPSDVSENDDDFDERMEGRPQKSLRKSNQTREKMPPLFSAIGPNTEVLGFTPKHRRIFLDLVMRYGLPSMDHNISDSQFFVRELKNKSEKHLRAYASLFISHLCEPGDPNALAFEDGVPKEGLNVSQVLARIGIISLIKRKVFEYEGKHGLVSMKKPKKPALSQPPAETRVENGSGPSTSNEVIEIKDDSSTANGEKAEEKSEAMEVDETSNKAESTDAEMKTVEDKTEQEKSTEAEESQDSSSITSKDKEESEASSSEAKSAEPESSENSKEKDTESAESEEQPKASETETETAPQPAEEEEEEEESNEVKTFEFNINDGGLTELHTLWYFEDRELKPKCEHEIWNRRHDYWMLAGIVKHGYERFNDIGLDEDFSIINEPFKSSPNLRDKFMERRLRLLEQALIFEEQLRRSAHLGSLEKFVKAQEEKSNEEEPNEKEEKMEAEEADTSKEPKENGEAKKTNGETTGEDKENECEQLVVNPSIQRVCNQIEDLLIDMKSDCARIPQTVQRIPSIANRLQIANPRAAVANPVPMSSTPTSLLNRLP